MAYCVLPFEFLSIQIKVLIIQRTACLHIQRSTLSKPGSPIYSIAVLKKADCKNTAISISKSKRNAVIIPFIKN